MRVTSLLVLALLVVAAVPARAQDVDADGIPDGADNCIEIANLDQNDTNLDGFGNLCDPDFNGDGVVGLPDFNALRRAFGSRIGDARFRPEADLNGDGVIGTPDFNTLRRFFGKAPGPGSTRSCDGRADGAACNDLDPSSSRDVCLDGRCVGAGLAAPQRPAPVDRTGIDQPFDEAVLKEFGLLATDIPAFDGDRLIARPIDLKGVPGSPEGILIGLLRALDINTPMRSLGGKAEDRSGVLRLLDGVLELGRGKPLPPDLARIFRQLFPGMKPPEPATPEQAKQAETLVREYLGLDEGMLRQYASRPRTVTVWEQLFDDVPIEGSQVLVIDVPGPQSRLVLGAKARLFRNIDPKNAPRIDDKEALASGAKQLESETGIKTIGLEERLPAPSLRLLPFDKGFLYAWRLHVATSQGQFTLWVDAADGSVLQQDGTRREGTVHTFEDRAPRDLGPGTDAFDAFTSDDVPTNPPVAGVHRLRNADTTDVVDSFGAEVTSADADFTNECRDGDTTGADAECTMLAGFNDDLAECSIFQEVNELREIFGYRGANAVEDLELRVNVGESSAWADLGVISAGRADSNRADCPNFSGTDDFLLSKSLDPSAIAHEFGHRVHANQLPAGSSFGASLSEGLGDYWGIGYAGAQQPNSTYRFNANDRLIEARFEPYVCRKRYWLDGEGPKQDGSVCRAGDPADQFEDRLAGGNECHVDGHVIHWALASARDEMRRLAPSFPLTAFAFDMFLIDALQAYGLTTPAGCTGTTDQQVHATYREVLDELLGVMAADVGMDRHVNQVQAGFARANLFETPSDAVINITDDFLAENGTAPSFEIWSGRPYGFTSAGAIDTSDPPFNTQYRLRVANDNIFSVNLFDSGWLAMDGSGSAQDAPCPEQSDGNCVVYTLTNATWQTLDSSARVYYRVDTRQPTGGERYSTVVHGGTVPFPWANVNADGNDCTCGIGSELIVLIPIGSWLRRRIRRRGAAA